MLSIMSSVIVRAMLSKVAAPADQGKIFSMVSCVEGVMPLAATPVVTLIYNSTIDSFPGTVYAVMSGIHLTVAAFIGYTYLLLIKPAVRYGLTPPSDADEDDEITTTDPSED